MPLSTKMFDWHDKEFRLADEIYLAVVSALTLIMLVGGVILWYKG